MLLFYKTFKILTRQNNVNTSFSTAADAPDFQNKYFPTPINQLTIESNCKNAKAVRLELGLFTRLHSTISPYFLNLFKRDSRVTNEGFNCPTKIDVLSIGIAGVCEVF